MAAVEGDAAIHGAGLGVRPVSTKSFTRIVLASGLLLKAYESGWIVGEEREYGPTAKNAGAKYDYDLGYYSSLRSALEGLMEHSVRQSDATSLHKLIGAIQAFRDEVSGLLAPSLTVRL